MQNIHRILNIKLPKGQSAFLWGARKTGKTTYLRSAFPKSIVYDFLKTDLMIEFSKHPHRLREELFAKSAEELKSPVILDEVQKVPNILDEVHWLIENKKVSFILCGSSARKLKRNHANMLGGRAWRYELFPLVSKEIKDINLLRSLNHGLIPSHYLQQEEEASKSLKAYVQDYLKQEVFDEGLTRNIPAFSRFFDAMAFSHGELTNYLNIARDCAIDAKTVKEYYQILVDTLLGRIIEPFSKRQSRQVITKASKFYLFDVGAAGSLINRKLVDERGEAFGRAFEHLIFMELNAYSSYSDKNYKINFWRTKSGLEVDFILAEGEVAIEVKGAKTINSSDLRPLNAFIEEVKPKKAILVCNEGRKRVVGPVSIMPWRNFLEKLWTGKIL
ncbi:MAG: AAA family ATPase [Elusimicrobia bacterium]|nr:AAA family ATPase [Candidatus Liberimonas magnetica]